MFRSALAISLFSAFSYVAASPLYVKNDNLTYSGTITRYGSEADARARTNALTPAVSIDTAVNGANSTIKNSRDGNVQVSESAPSAYASVNEAVFQTAWYFTNETSLNRNINGWGNPNNRNEGFVQFLDRGTNAARVPTVNGGWSNSYTTFNLSITGGDGDYGNFARLWAAPSTLGSSTAGLFLDFNLNLTAQFLSAATLSATTSWYETNVMPSNLFGTATGIFLNDSSQPTLNGYYAFDFVLTNANNSFAFANGATWNNASGGIAPTSLFAAPGITNIPLPSTLALMSVLFVCLIGRTRAI